MNQLPELTREADVLRHVVDLVVGHMPPTWTTSTTYDLATLRGHRIDAAIEVSSPDGRRVVLIVEAKRSLVVRDLPAVAAQLYGVAEQLRDARSVPVVIARYLAPSTRQWLTEHGLSYADATGNMRLSASEPALFIRDTGADRDPWRGPGRPRATLNGEPAARVVRALVDHAEPMTVPELVVRSGASTGATYRVVRFLEQEALIGRETTGRITTVDWPRILLRWSEDYGFQRSNAVTAYLHPRGLDAVLARLREQPGLGYALTGTFAAEPLHAYAPARLGMLYVADAVEAARDLGLRAVDAGANVLLAATTYDVVFERTAENDGLRLVAPGQAVVDLLTAPGRGPAEGQALLEWMRDHESDWRI